MPSEKPLDRFPATLLRPVSSSTSPIRRFGRLLVSARQRRWLSALRPPCTARASSSAPTSRIGQAAWRNGRPLTVTVPAVGRSRPRIIRMVVVLPAPFGPRKPVIFPGSTRKDRPSTAVVPPYRLVRRDASIMSKRSFFPERGCYSSRRSKLATPSTRTTMSQTAAQARYGQDGPATAKNGLARLPPSASWTEM